MLLEMAFQSILRPLFRVACKFYGLRTIKRLGNQKLLLAFEMFWNKTAIANPSKLHSSIVNCVEH